MIPAPGSWAPSAGHWADNGRAASRLHRRLTTLDQLFDFLLSLPDRDIARDVNQFQVHLVEDRSGTITFIHQAVDRTLEHKICSGFLARRFCRVSTGVLRLIKAFLARLWALSGIGDQLYLS